MPGAVFWVDMSLSKFWEMVKDTEAWHAAAHGVPKSQTRLSNRTTKNTLSCNSYKGGTCIIFQFTNEEAEAKRASLRSHSWHRGPDSDGKNVTTEWALFFFSWLRCVFVAFCGFTLVAESRGFPLVVVHRLLIAVASLAAEHRL